MYVFTSTSSTVVPVKKTARKVNDMYGDRAPKENIARFWFQRFRSTNIDVQKKPSGRLHYQ